MMKDLKVGDELLVVVYGFGHSKVKQIAKIVGETSKSWKIRFKNETLLFLKQDLSQNPRNANRYATYKFVKKFERPCCIDYKNKTKCACLRERYIQSADMILYYCTAYSDNKKAPKCLGYFPNKCDECIFEVQDD